MEKERELNIDINYYRGMGVDFCETDGSNHYSQIREENGIDAIEIAILNNTFEDFAITNILKYILRFKKTRNPDDLKKVADYAHILCGIELDEKEGEN